MAPKRIENKSGTDRHPFLLSVDDVVSQLGTNLETGLTSRRVAELTKQYPPNELDDGGGVAWTTILLKQVSNAMILVCTFVYVYQMECKLIFIGSYFCYGALFRC